MARRHEVSTQVVTQGTDQQHMAVVGLFSSCTAVFVTVLLSTGRSYVKRWLVLMLNTLRGSTKLQLGCGTEHGTFAACAWSVRLRL